MIENNPLLNVAKNPSFEDIEAKHVDEAIDVCLSESLEILSKLEKESDISWKSIMQPLEEISRKTESSWGVVAHLHSVRNSSELREAYNRSLPKVIEFSLKISQSEALFSKVVELAKQSKELSAAQNRAIELFIKNAKLSGMELEGRNKEKFNEISKKLSELSTKFSNNVLDATKQYQLTVSNPNDLEGVPAMFKELWSSTYQEKTSKDSTPKDGPWIITLDHASATPFLKYCPNRELRKELYYAQIQRASTGDLDNSPLIKEIVELRKEKASLLGFNNFSDLSIASKMAPNINSIYELISELQAPSVKVAQAEISEIESLAKSLDSIDKLQNWDFSYYSEKLKEKKYAFSDEELRQYFPINSVLSGLFKLASNLFEIEIKKSSSKPQVWSECVEHYIVSDKNGKQVSSFFLDAYSRPENKRGGAWVNSCLDRGVYQDEKILPVCYIVCNFTPPTKTKPSLLSFYEVETLFHEFGHALQQMLTKVDVLDVAGINGIDWDAVELPSQFMENWCYHKNSVKQFASHFESGEVIPDHLFDKIIASKNYLSAYQMLRQLLFAKTDLDLHTDFSPLNSSSAFELYKSNAKTMAPIQPQPEDRFLCSFGHIFAGGYSAGYYSYKWAEVLSADAFSKFEEAGFENEEEIKKIGLEFKNTVLSLGGSINPMDVFIKFRGRKPSTKALLKHSGLI